MRSGHPHDHHVVHIYQLIAWTGSRPSEPLKLLWKDIDFSKGIYTKDKEWAISDVTDREYDKANSGSTALAT